MLWIVGKVFSDFSDYLDEHHIDYGVFADVRKPVRVPDNHPVVQLDMSAEDSLLSSLQSLPEKPEVTAIMTAGYEQYVLPAAWLSQYFDVPGPTPDAARAATNKTLMREAFAAKYPEITPASHPVSSWQDVEDFVASHPFPVMLKPSNLMKSLFVTQNNDMAELRANFDTMTHELPKLQQSIGLAEPPTILIEEFMSGSMHTVAGFVDAQGEVHFLSGIADCLTAQNIGVSDNYLFSRMLPTSLSAEQRQAMLDVARKGVEALGLTSSPLHIELILTPSGAKIIEIGARIGGYRSRMYAFAEGVDMYRASIDIAEGQVPNLDQTTAKACAFIELFPATVGKLSAVRNAEQLADLPSLITATPKRKPGDVVGPAKQGYRAVEVFMLGHKDPAVVQKDIEFIKNNVSVEVS